MVYGISSAVRTPKLATEFNIITGVQHENLDLFITEVKDFILKLDSTITEDMVEQEKKRIIKTLPIKYQTSSDYYNLMDLCQKIGLTPLEYAEIHNSITLSDVQTVITYLKQADWVLARSK
jgi:predicted Zn-dependent peptidase